MNTQSSTHNRQDWQTIKNLFPYLWQFKYRVIFAISCLILAKLTSVTIPLYLKDIIDQLGLPPQAITLPIAALIGYGIARLASSIFAELRDILFARVTQGAIEKVATELFEHLFTLSMRFHLNRQTGGLTRDIERGTKSIGFLLNFMVFHILPTLLEIAMVAVILLWRYDFIFTLVTLGTIVTYISFTLVVTGRRMVFRRTMNSLDSQANTKAIDALLNYETVKYFGNEHYEVDRYQKNLKQWVGWSVKNQISLNLLNAGQSVIITIGVTILLFLSAKGVVNGELKVGDVVLVSAYLTQLYAPLSFLGVIYREIKNALADMERMFDLMKEGEDIKDKSDAQTLTAKKADVCFKNVDFHYKKNRQILHYLNFKIPAGQTVAVVGATGAGKSTLSRLLFRFYDVTAGSITINNIDIRDITQKSLREHIGIVPQDTVLFNDTIGYNIAYGKPGSAETEIIAAAKAASIHDFIMSLPEGYDTQVGERGLKLSGGEKQRVAIARTLLKNPPILILDEATSALDTRTERAIQEELLHIAQNRTTLIIAHRLSTIVHADTIIVMNKGKIIEQGKHSELIKKEGQYAQMWMMQQTQNNY